MNPVTPGTQEPPRAFHIHEEDTTMKKITNAQDAVRGLRGRARHLRRQANVQPAPLALAYRRRASELELQAEVLDEKLLKLSPGDRELAAA